MDNAGRQARLERVRRAVAGDQPALSVLLAECQPQLNHRLQRRIPPQLQSVIHADDVLQEAYAAAFQNIRRLEVHDADSFDRWLGTIAMRRLRNMIRNHYAARRGGRAAAIRPGDAMAESACMLLDLIQAPERTPSRVVRRSEAVAGLGEVLQTLDPDQREAVRRVYLEGQSVEAAAAAMGRTDRAIHNLCHRARARLGELLRGRGISVSSI